MLSLSSAGKSNSKSGYNLKLTHLLIKYVNLNPTQKLEKERKKEKVNMNTELGSWIGVGCVRNYHSTSSP